MHQPINHLYFSHKPYNYNGTEKTYTITNTKWIYSHTCIKRSHLGL